MLKRSTIQLLRFHFSLFLLPVFLFAVSQAPHINWKYAVLVFLILHLIVYPASNGYNSYMDRDETPIGGLSSPMQPTRQLFHVTLVMDVIAIMLSLYINWIFSVGVLLYILASRAYSYRGIRLKKYPLTGFLTVFIFQGALIFFITYQAIAEVNLNEVPILPAFIASCLIGSLYPLTQVYQHEEDGKDGVVTISMWLGKKGTFLFSMLFFLSGSMLMYKLFSQQGALDHFFIFLGVMLPVVLFFMYWMLMVWKDPRKADFRNSLLMNLLSTIFTLIFFIILIVLNH